MSINAKSINTGSILTFMLVSMEAPMAHKSPVTVGGAGMVMTVDCVDRRLATF